MVSDTTSSGAGRSCCRLARDALANAGSRASPRAAGRRPPDPPRVDPTADRAGRPAAGPSEALRVVARLARELVELPPLLPHDVEAADRLAAAADRLRDAVAAAERRGARRSEILAELAPVRSAIGRSPVLGRMQCWPRGYRGDFETVDALAEGDVGAPPWELAWFVERHVRDSPLLAQHRNRSAWVSERACAAIAAGEAVLSLCSGSAAEIDSALRAAQRIHAARPVRESATVVVHDFDAGACDAARQRLGARAGHCRFVAGPLADSLQRASRFGPYAMIVSVGLLDHVGDAAAIQLLSVLATHAGIGGPGTRICLANAVENDRYRFWLEYLVDWPLVARSRERLERIVRASGIGRSPASVSSAIERDATGLAWLLEVTLAGGELRSR